MLLGFFQVLPALGALFLLSAFFTLRAGLHASLAPLAGLSVVGCVLTLGGMAGFLRPAALALYLLAYGLGIWAMWAELRAAQPKKNAPALARPAPLAARLLPPGAVVFWGMSLACAVYFAWRQPQFFEFDEYSLWGTAAKLMSTQNVLYTEGTIGWPWQASQNCGLMVLSYFMQLFGTFAPWKTHLANNILLFACFGAVVGGLKWKDYALAFPVAVISFLVPFLFSLPAKPIYVDHTYMLAYGDIPAGILFGGAVVFWLVLRQTGGPFWCILPVLAMTANIKSNTFVLALAAAGIVAVDLILFTPKKPWQKGLWLRLCKALAAFAAPLLLYGSWGAYIARLVQTSAMGTTSEDLITVALSGIKMLIGLPVGEYYEMRRARFAYSVRAVASAFLHTRITLLGSGLAVVCAITVLFLFATLLAKGWQRRVHTLLIWLLCAACFAGYNFMLMLSYAFVFTEQQAAALVDYNRYLYTFYMGWFFIALALVCMTAVGKWRRISASSAMLVLAAVFVVLFQTNLPREMCVLGYDDSEFVDITVAAGQAQEAVAEIETDPDRSGELSDQRIFFVSQGDTGWNWFCFSYHVLPLVLDYSGDPEIGAGGGTFGLPELAYGEYYCPYTAGQFMETVLESGCTYLFVQHSNDVLVQSYAELFADGLAAAQAGPAVYRVTADGFVPLRAGGTE